MSSILSLLSIAAWLYFCGIGPTLATELKQSTEDVTVHISAEWHLRMCDRTGFCTQRTDDRNMYFYFLSSAVYFYTVHLPLGSGLGVVMPLAGGEGEYRTVGTTAFEKIRMALENEAYLINYMSGWEGVQSQMTLQLKIDSGGCGVQIKEFVGKGLILRG